MTAVVEGLGDAERERVRGHRRSGDFFWIDLHTGGFDRHELIELLGVSHAALGPLLDFSEGSRASRSFYADGRAVAFGFSFFEDASGIDVHVLVTGEFVLTVHERDVSLPRLLAIEDLPGRSEQYMVYAILDAMVRSAFDALSESEFTMDRIQESATSKLRSNVRLETLRSVSSELSGLRRRVGPQRAVFERVGVELAHVEGLAGDHERYFEHVAQQLNRLVEAIDAAAQTLANLIDLRLNETSYWLTVVATIFLPLTFVTGFFGMNFGWMVDHVDSAPAFVLLGVCLPVLAVVAVLRLVRWITAVDPAGQSARRRR